MCLGSHQLNGIYLPFPSSHSPNIHHLLLSTQFKASQLHHSIPSTHNSHHVLRLLLLDPPWITTIPACLFLEVFPAMSKTTISGHERTVSQSCSRSVSHELTHFLFPPSSISSSLLSSLSFSRLIGALYQIGI
jgi:hypothetical protein